ncbi:MAG TPA: NERD domain-containing protein [Dissulfurispiraceae bacterium]|nr:NERD domain-containing protein [Dissulfurispiraceae bacterium]
MSMMNNLKGWIGEKVTQAGMWAFLDDKEYQRYTDILVKTENGTTQIDHIVLSKYGLFVIETKNYQGWIFGRSTQIEWTQSIYGKKNRFQNPLHQNYKHTKTLAQYLGIDHSLIIPIIWFIGDVTFKTEMPANVLAGGLIPYIKEFKRVVFSEDEIVRLASRLSFLKDCPVASSKEHVDQLKERFNSNVTCPKCGSALVQRTARQGAAAGKTFFGCSAFPKCRYVKN